MAIGHGMSYTNWDCRRYYVHICTSIRYKLLLAQYQLMPERKENMLTKAEYIN